jgi:hypothetical protein
MIHLNAVRYISIIVLHTLASVLSRFNPSETVCNTQEAAGSLSGEELLPSTQIQRCRTTSAACVRLLIKYIHSYLSPCHRGDGLWIWRIAINILNEVEDSRQGVVLQFGDWVGELTPCRRLDSTGSRYDPVAGYCRTVRNLLVPLKMEKLCTR